MTRLVAALLFLIMASTPAAAQSASAGFVRGFGGVSFLSEAGGVFGGAVGIRLAKGWDVIGDFGRLTNMLPRKIQRDLDAAARELGGFYGAPLTIDGKAPAFYGLGGIRVSRVAGQRMQMFVEAGGGLARGTSDITARAGTSDVSREVVAILRIKHSERRALLAIGGGVAIPLSGHLAVDVGYRFMRIFTADPRINTGTMTAGFSWGF